MPSTTPNYGWTYPISSDDLNAGATSIGSLATGADASLAAEANARSSQDSYLLAALNNKVRAGNGTSQNITATVFSGTTDSLGRVSINCPSWLTGWLPFMIICGGGYYDGGVYPVWLGCAWNYESSSSTTTFVFRVRDNSTGGYLASKSVVLPYIVQAT